MELDLWISRALAHLVHDHSLAQRVLVVLAEGNFTKALFFAPLLLALWLRGRPKEQAQVVVLCASCALALVPVWFISAQWVRYKPIHHEYGVPEMAAIFARYFALKPEYFRWGSFPSDNAAFLSAMSFGIMRARPRFGLLSLVVTVFLNGMFRVTVGLHYLSDILAGALLGWGASVLSFRLANTSIAASRLLSLCRWIDGNLWAKGLGVLFLIEFAVMFHDLRFLDPIVFGAVAPGR